MRYLICAMLYEMTQCSIFNSVISIIETYTKIRSSVLCCFFASRVYHERSVIWARTSVTSVRLLTNFLLNSLDFFFSMKCMHCEMGTCIPCVEIRRHVQLKQFIKCLIKEVQSVFDLNKLCTLQSLQHATTCLVK